MIWFKAGLRWIWETFKVAWPLWGATIVTAGFARWVYFLANEVTVQEPYRATRWEHFLHGRPNELGDTLAGFVGSLTLIWVVASVIQQSMELKAQREEFKKMAEAQAAQVRALKTQADIFEDERVDRQHDRVKKTLDEMLYDLLSEIEFERNIHGSFACSLEGNDPVELHVFYRLGQEVLDGKVLDEKMKCASRNAFMASRDFKSLIEKGAISVQLTSKRGYYEYVAGKAEKITKLYGGLSPDQKVRLESIGVKSMHASLQEILNLGLWSATP